MEMENSGANATEGLAMKRLVTVRLATKKDAPFIHKLVGELADYQKLTSAFVATDKELEETLFNLPPYQGPTTFILESTVPIPPENRSIAAKITDEGAAMAMAVPVAMPMAAMPAAMAMDQRSRDADEGASSEYPVYSQEIALRSEIDDTAMEAYECPGMDATRVVVGFVLFFPNYSTLVAKAGYYVEDLYIREPYRGHGFGTVLLKTVAQQALKRGAERLEWCVLNWDDNAIKFYKGLGAAVLPDWRICRLDGDALRHCDQILQFNLQISQPELTQ